MIELRMLHNPLAAGVLFALVGCAEPVHTEQESREVDSFGQTLRQAGFGGVAVIPGDAYMPNPSAPFASDRADPEAESLENFTQRWASQLAAADVGYGVIWTREQFEDEHYWELARKTAIELQRPLAISLLLPNGSDEGAEQRGERPADYAQSGRFPNATNCDAYRALVHDFMQAWNENVTRKAGGKHVVMPAIAVDLEMRMHQLAALQKAMPGAEQFKTALQALDGKGPVAAAQAIEQLVLDMLDGTTKHEVQRLLRLYAATPAEYEHARIVFRDTVKDLKDAGYGVGVTTLLPMLDDFDDGDDDLRRAFQVPLEDADGEIAWDGISFQAQRSLYSSRTTYGLTVPPSFVYDYAKKTVDRFGPERSGIGLGLTEPGPAFKAPSYANPTNLANDVSRANAAGIARNNIGVFSWNGILRRGGLAVWSVDPEPEAPNELAEGVVGRLFAAVWSKLDDCELFQPNSHCLSK